MIPLVWVPGHLCSAWLYAPLMGRWPGPETVAETTRDDSLATMAARLLAETEGPLALAGLSMGGMVALEAMAAAPDRIAGALLMDTDPFAARERETAWRAGEMAAGPESYIARFTAKFFAHDAAVAERLGPAARAQAAAMVPEVIAAQARALDTRRDMMPLVEGFEAPVEIVVGAEDRVCPPKLHRPLAEALPGAVFTEIPGCGHLATVEAPEAVAARLDALAARIGP